MAERTGGSGMADLRPGGGRGKAKTLPATAVLVCPEAAVDARVWTGCGVRPRTRACETRFSEVFAGCRRHLSDRVPEGEMQCPG